MLKFNIDPKRITGPMGYYRLGQCYPRTMAREGYPLKLSNKQIILILEQTYEVALSFAKELNLTSSTIATLEVALDLGKTLDLINGTQLSLEAALSLAKSLDFSVSSVVTFEAALNIAKACGFNTQTTSFVCLKTILHTLKKSQAINPNLRFTQGAMPNLKQSGGITSDLTT